MQNALKRIKMRLQLNKVKTKQSKKAKHYINNKCKYVNTCVCNIINTCIYVNTCICTCTTKCLVIINMYIVNNVVI
jgi:hypothetical protein